MILKIKVTTGKGKGTTIYYNDINGEDYQQIANVLKDLKSLNIPIEKAIKKFTISKSDWDVALFPV